MTDERDELANVDNVEIEPLSDQDLDSVAGGTGSNTCTCSNCATFTCPPSNDQQFKTVNT